jgi:HlyD family secretion protein
MKLKDYKEQIEQKSEEVHEIMGHIPHWFLRIGISIIFGLLLFGLILAYFVKYPDIIKASILITTDSPPVKIISRTTGKIDTILVHNKQKVRKDAVLATINNTASYQDILNLGRDLNTLPNLHLDTNKFIIFPEKAYQLGTIQDQYLNLLKSIKNYNNFFKISFHKKKTQYIKRAKTKKRKFSSY